MIIKVSTVQMADFIPNFHSHRAFKVAGLRRWHSLADAPTTIPPQWNEFNRMDLPNRRETTETFGVTCQMDMSNQRMEYLAGYEVEHFAGLPENIERIIVPGAFYAVFKLGTVSEIRPLWQHVFSIWLPSSGYKPAGTPDFERYDETFDEVTRGPLEVWLPIQAKA